MEGMDAEPEKTEEAAIIINEPAMTNKPEKDDEMANADAGAEVKIEAETATNDEFNGTSAPLVPETTPKLSPEELDRLTRLRAATKRLRNAYTAAKRRYRIPQKRIDRIQAALSKFVGTVNYHNYTIQKTYRDPSAKRHIKSFNVNPEPIPHRRRP